MARLRPRCSGPLRPNTPPIRRIVAEHPAAVTISSHSNFEWAYAVAGFGKDCESKRVRRPRTITPEANTKRARRRRANDANIAVAQGPTSKKSPEGADGEKSTWLAKWATASTSPIRSMARAAAGEDKSTHPSPASPWGPRTRGSTSQPRRVASRTKARPTNPLAPVTKTLTLGPNLPQSQDGNAKKVGSAGSFGQGRKPAEILGQSTD